MVDYCARTDVSSRLGFDSAQRTRAGTRIDRYISQASIEIEECFRDYGRSSPSSSDVLTEICADLAAAYYMQDEGTAQTANDGGLRGQTLEKRAMRSLLRLAHLGA